MWVADTHQGCEELAFDPSHLFDDRSNTSNVGPKSALGQRTFKAGLSSRAEKPDTSQQHTFLPCSEEQCIVSCRCSMGSQRWLGSRRQRTYDRVIRHAKVLLD